MTWQGTLYIVLLVAAAAVLAVSVLYIWRRHRVAAALTVAFILLLGSTWMLGLVLEITSTSSDAKLFWEQVMYIPITMAAPAWLIFSLLYSGREKWVTRRNLALLAIIPATTLTLVFTSTFHGLIWRTTEPSVREPFILLEHTHGFWYWVHTAYSYILVLWGAVLLIQVLARSQRLYRWQIIALLLAAFFPLIQSILELLGLYPVPYLLVTVVLLPLACLAVAMSIFRFRPGDIVPVARGSVIESMRDGVVVLDSKNRIVDLNPAAQHLMGSSAVIGKSMEEAWPSWSLSEGVKKVQKEIVCENESGRHVYDVGISPLTDWRGNIVSHVVVFRDITERKHAEDLLYESEEKFRTLFENASDEIIYIDRNGRILNVNEKVKDIFGYNPEEIVGKSFHELGFLGIENMTEIAELFDGVIQGNVIPSFFEMELKRKNGGKAFLEISARLIKKNDEIEGILAIVRDVTERKRAEEQIRTSLKEKEILLREIHHRVKNNLQVISSLLNLQSITVKDSHFKEVLKESQNRIKSMALIHEKLYRSENLADIDSKEYVTSLVEELVRSYGGVAGRVTLNIEVENVSLKADTAIPCGLIITELVSNSLKHAFPDRKGTITVKLHPVDGAIELRITDDGVGIPETIDFRNAETLGLRLVTILAEDQLDGSITMDRTRGTDFCITFKGTKA